MGCVGLFELITYERMPKGGIFLGHSRSVALPFVGGLPPAVLSRTFTVVYCNFAPAFTAKLQLHHCLQLTPATGAIKPSKPRPDSSIAYVSGSGIAVGGCPGA